MEIIRIIQSTSCNLNRPKDNLSDLVCQLFSRPRYSWGPAHMQCRLCSNCWNYWKKHGGLKMPTRIDGDRSVPTPRPGSTDGSNEGTPDRTGRESTTPTQIEFTEKTSTHLQPHRPHRCSVGEDGRSICACVCACD